MEEIMLICWNLGFSYPTFQKCTETNICQSIPPSSLNVKNWQTAQPSNTDWVCPLSPTAISLPLCARHNWPFHHVSPSYLCVYSPHQDQWEQISLEESKSGSEVVLCGKAAPFSSASATVSEPAWFHFRNHDPAQNGTDNGWEKKRIE